ncbi:hypothetical protein DFJ77DRAFT_442152 [Powellomyces hirtus]|nr:hypothetical protein DFJ77DRAFT_442152 [Powellomyces hirtus]
MDGCLTGCPNVCLSDVPLAAIQQDLTTFLQPSKDFISIALSNACPSCLLNPHLPYPILTTRSGTFPSALTCLVRGSRTNGSHSGYRHLMQYHSASVGHSQSLSAVQRAHESATSHRTPAALVTAAALRQDSTQHPKMHPPDTFGDDGTLATHPPSPTVSPWPKRGDIVYKHAGTDLTGLARKGIMRIAPSWKRAEDGGYGKHTRRRLDPRDGASPRSARGQVYGARRGTTVHYCRDDGIPRGWTHLNRSSSRGVRRGRVARLLVVLIVAYCADKATNKYFGFSAEATKAAGSADTSGKPFGALPLLAYPHVQTLLKIAAVITEITAQSWREIVRLEFRELNCHFDRLSLGVITFIFSRRTPLTTAPGEPAKGTGLTSQRPRSFRQRTPLKSGGSGRTGCAAHFALDPFSAQYHDWISENYPLQPCGPWWQNLVTNQRN